MLSVIEVNTTMFLRQEHDLARLKRRRHLSAWLMLAVIFAGIVFAFESSAHHHASHARRLNAAAVWLDVVTKVSDGCTKIEKVSLGTPDGASRPSDAVPVTVKLQRPPPGIACIQVISTQRSSQEIFVPRGEFQLHLYFVDSDGTIVRTERVRIEGN